MISDCSSSLRGAACTEITAARTYDMAADLTGDNFGCLNIHDTSNVSLDCQHHTIQAPAMVLFMNARLRTAPSFGSGQASSSAAIQPL